jgi:transposase
MHIRIYVSKKEYRELLNRLQLAYVKGQVRLIRRIQSLLYLFDGKTIAEVAELLSLAEQTVRNYLSSFILKRLDSLKYKQPTGRRPKLTKTQRKELYTLVEAGPEAAGYDFGCWTTAIIQDLIYQRYGVSFSVHYMAELLKNIGLTYQKARFVSEHLDDVEPAQKEWMEQTWPEIMTLAEEKEAMVLFEDEASFAQWGSLSYTWAPKGKQPTVKTSGKRKAYKIFGLIDYFSGRFFYKGHQGRFNSDSYREFLQEVLAQTEGHLIIIHDGAPYHTSKAIQQFVAKNAERLTVYKLPSYSPEFNPIEYLWRNIKKYATHLRYFPTFEDLQKKVDEKLLYFAQTPERIKNLMGKYCKTLGTEAV